MNHTPLDIETHDELLQLAEAVVTQQADDAQRVRLAELLTGNDAAQQFYIAYLDQQSQLRWLFRGATEQEDNRQEAEVRRQETGGRSQR